MHVRHLRILKYLTTSHNERNTMGTIGITSAELPRLDKRFFIRAGASGLGGGAVLAGVMMVSGATHGMGATSIFSQCFASFIWPMSTMAKSTMPTTTMAKSTMPTTTMAKSTMPTHHAAGAMGTAHGATANAHALVGALIHFALSASLGVVILSAIVLAGSAGLTILTKPAGMIAASIVASVVIYFVVARGIAPVIDHAFGSGLSQSAFFLAHVLFGATVGILGAFWLRRPGHSSM
jgi:hypothetical protein